MSLISKLRIQIVLLCGIALLGVAACSPVYVMRAGVEQAKILWHRKPIAELVASEKTPPLERTKLELVLEARAFAESQGLTPGGSFLKYSRVDRDVLLWVLSGSAKTSFSPVTWWFPIVGRVPYKGFFERADGIKELNRLKARHFDAVLRPSPAFSTLGWFDDPLLSTTLRTSENGLVNTVIHEILHSTIWIPGSVSFNESLANTLGHLGAIQFFRERYPESSWVRDAEADWEDEKAFAGYIKGVYEKLDALYSKSKQDGLGEEQILESRQRIVDRSIQEWNSLRTTFKSPGMQKLELQLNNAVIIGYRLYLDRLELFEQFLNQHRTSTGALDLPAALAALKKIADAAKNSEDPFALLTACAGTSTGNCVDPSKIAEPIPVIEPVAN